MTVDFADNNAIVRHMIKNLPGVLAVPVIVLLGQIGCSSSSSTLPELPSAAEDMQKEINALQVSNDSLKAQAAKLEQEKRALSTRITDLERQIDTLKTQPPPVEEKMPVHRQSSGSYQDALNEFRQRNYNDAAGIFQQLLDNGAPKGLADNCTYWIGECLFAQKRYDEAIAQFRKVFDFQWSEKKDDSQLMIANAYLAQGNKGKAREEYQRLIKKFPASPFVKRANAKLAKL